MGFPGWRKLGSTLDKRTTDILSHVDHPGASNGPAETINDQLDHLHGTALGFRNLANYIRRALFDISSFRAVLRQ